ncbi:MAG: hypothetical protein PHS96_07290, partial [Anaerolineales bacterium]|nr:hypothetical protein [Anaerolineales bacterium]
MTNGVKALTLSLALLLLALLLFSPSRGAELSLLSTKTPPPPGEAETLQGEVEQAIRNAIFDQAGLAPVFELYTTHIDHISISQDGEWAIAWLNPQDAETGELIAAEPGLSIVKRKGTEWYAILPGFSNWTGAVEDAPEELLSPEEKATWLEMNAQALAPAGLGPFSGYLLPWAGGDTLYMTQSVKHDKYTPSGNAHYAFDFATPGV